MKKCLFLWAMALVMAGAVCSCSKSDDDGFEMTYADDDFIMTPRNIKEKLIGEWEFESLMIYNGGWEKLSADELGEAKDATIRSNGTCDLLCLDGAEWSMSGDTITVSSLCMIGTYNGGQTIVRLGNGFRWLNRKNAENMLRRKAEDVVITTERQLLVRLRASVMKKDYFRLDYIKSPFGAAVNCTIKRR